MANARPFSISTLQEISNDLKNTSMQGVLDLAVELKTFGREEGRVGSPGIRLRRGIT
jgi:hypothetical protein